MSPCLGEGGSRTRSTPPPFTRDGADPGGNDRGSEFSGFCHPLSARPPPRRLPLSPSSFDGPTGCAQQDPGGPAVAARPTPPVSYLVFSVAASGRTVGGRAGQSLGPTWGARCFATFLSFTLGIPPTLSEATLAQPSSSSSTYLAPYSFGWCFLHTTKGATDTGGMACLAE